MDIELARTFLQIARSGSFVAAAEHLHVTQTTVTARVHNLETQLGCALFVRNRAGAKLTDDGERFVAYAMQLVQTWEAARRDLPLPSGAEETLRLGAEFTLSNPLQLQWVMQLRRELPKPAIRVEIGESEMLQQRLERGLLDAVLVYRPEYRAGMQVVQVMEEKLIQIASTGNPEPYIYVDWGPDFRREHDAALPEKTRHVLSFTHGPQAMHYLIQCGGSGYFRTRVTKRGINEGRIRVVPNAPEFSYPVFLVYSRERESALLQQAFEILRRVVAEEGDWTEHWELTP